MSAATALAQDIGIASACRALGVSRATWYRSRQLRVRAPRPTPPRTLRPEERARVLAVLASPPYRNLAPHQVYAHLLDAGTYVCSIRTMYRVLHGAHQVRERRAQLAHPPYATPRLVATGPRQVWSWDITKLRGPAKGHVYYLYVILDIFSRYVVGWLVATTESAALAHRLIDATCSQEGIRPTQLALHADRGASMKSKTVAQLLADLGVLKSHSRPRVSNDNPFSESQFKTLKYTPAFPKRFGGLEDARAFCQAFFAWYNHDHRHSGIGLHAPAVVHAGLVAEVDATRQHALHAAYQAHPERFVRRPPTPPTVPPTVWINPPEAATMSIQP